VHSNFLTSLKGQSKVSLVVLLCKLIVRNHFGQVSMSASMHTAPFHRSSSNLKRKIFFLIQSIVGEMNLSQIPKVGDVNFFVSDSFILTPLEQSIALGSTVLH
jgi:hypothetical protein